MTSDRARHLVLIAAIILIVGAIMYLEPSRNIVPSGGQADIVVETADPDRVSEKAKLYQRAKDITTPDAFLNAEPFALADLIGEKVILLDFWTYSCINCRRTLPYLNAWWKEYEDDGLVIVGVHTPEFEFEKEYANVSEAVDLHDILYPVVMDNDFSTWQSYNNRYWPRKYLIDIDGFVVYDHIGEGGYEETEAEIVKALAERKRVLGERVAFDDDVEPVGVMDVDFDKVKSPEVYFGARRNTLLGNGKAGRKGEQTFSRPAQPEPNTLYLIGTWNITDEYAEAMSPDAGVLFMYNAKNVYFVAESGDAVQVRVVRDGSTVAGQAGVDVTDDGRVTVDMSDIYHLIAEDEYSEHLLELHVGETGLRIYTFTFG